MICRVIKNSQLHMHGWLKLLYPSFVREALTHLRLNPSLEGEGVVHPTDELVNHGKVYYIHAINRSPLWSIVGFRIIGSGFITQLFFG